MIENIFNLSENLQSFIKDLIIAICILVLGYFFLKITKNIVFKQINKIIRKTENILTRQIIEIFDKHFISITYFSLFYITLKEIELNSTIFTTVKTIVVIVTTICIAQFLIDLSKTIVYYYGDKYHNSNSIIERNIKALCPAIRIFIWTLALISILSNLGFDIAAIIAGLGIGGVALALASQGILQDLFSYFAILFDRPFEISDLIAVGDFMGHVEHIGIKTTRIKAITGEQIILANTDLTSSRLRNFKRMEKRQVILKIGVTYETDEQKLGQIPDIIQEAIKNINNITFDIAYFYGFGDFSLNFEVVYYVDNNDMRVYRLARNEVNLAIKNAFSEHQLEFAYPTQVHYLSSINNNE
ncbi:mechanosensitive ion channel family protein [Geminocystis sp. GBBB08]|uniref:mechanosensitive ion channel family protein n=1 Tax=Geminocystis sp. GBBB08 TaxID=2604140 RepID=UPI0027E219DF|nr:mechanosensitive ion channel family protein [Geminocystis sp. GBBB08]MBL1209513.1 mechanosensitive ion channel family protein [Geminocystis sp. GBBB08]